MSYITQSLSGGGVVCLVDPPLEILVVGNFIATIPEASFLVLCLSGPGTGVKAGLGGVGLSIHKQTDLGLLEEAAPTVLLVQFFLAPSSSGGGGELSIRGISSIRG